jgi:hypothetical protein
MTGTLPRVARPRGTLTDEQLRRLTKAGKKRDDATAAYRAEVVAVLLEGRLVQRGPRRHRPQQGHPPAVEARGDRQS